MKRRPRRTRARTARPVAARGRRAAAQRPRGRAAVMAEVAANATILFARFGPHAVSLREVAAASGVNHALIHRYFGSKEDLLRVVLDRAGQEVVAEVQDLSLLRGGVPRLMEASRAVAPQFRAFAHAILSGSRPRSIRGARPPLNTQLVRMLRAERAPRGDVDPRVAAAAIEAALMGWVSFGDFALALNGLRASARVNAQVDRLLEAMTERALRGAGRDAKGRSGRRRAAPRG